MMWKKTVECLPKKESEYLVAYYNNEGEKVYRTLYFEAGRFMNQEGRPWMGVVQWIEIPGDDEGKPNNKKVLIGCAIIMMFVVASCFVGA